GHYILGMLPVLRQIEFPFLTNTQVIKSPFIDVLNNHISDYVTENSNVSGVREELNRLVIHKDQTFWSECIPCQILSPKALQKAILRVLMTPTDSPSYQIIDAATGCGKTYTLFLILGY